LINRTNSENVVYLVNCIITESYSWEVYWERIWD